MYRISSGTQFQIVGYLNANGDLVPANNNAEHEARMAAERAAAERRQQEIRRQQAEAERIRKQTEKNNHIRTKQSLQSQLNTITNNYNNEYNKLQQINQSYLDIHAKVNTQSKIMQPFLQEAGKTKGDILIVLGMTGSGKSTFCNRFIGDKSRKGDKGNNKYGVFKVSSGIHSQTITLDIKIIKNENNKKEYTIVDTPGASDTKQRDFDFKNGLSTYLKYLQNGINSFLIFFQLSNPRLDSWFQQLLNYYQNLFGQSFWKHVIIIATKADAVDEDDLSYLINNLRSEIIKQMNLKDLEEKSNDDNNFLPVIPIGKQNYEESLNNLIKVIPSQKYNCGNITTDLEKLKFQEQQINAQKNNLSNKVNTLYHEKSTIQGKITMIDNMLVNL